MASNEDSESMTNDTFQPVRIKYRQLTADMQELAETAGNNGFDMTKVKDSLAAANDAFIQVKRPREAMLDGKYLRLITQVTKNNIESSQASLLKFNPMEFADKLKLFMNVRSKNDLHKDESWITLEKCLSPCHPRYAHGLEPMIPALEGVLQVTQREPRQARQPASKETFATKKLMQSQTVNSEEAQTEEVSRVFKVLRRRFKDNQKKPICYMSFVINPTSFSLTIENIFHVAFLCRDGYAEISLDEFDLPTISPIVERQTGDNKKSSNQFIQQMNLEYWHELIEVFDIKEAMIPVPEREGSNKRSLV